MLQGQLLIVSHYSYTLSTARLSALYVTPVQLVLQHMTLPLPPSTISQSNSTQTFCICTNFSTPWLRPLNQPVKVNIYHTRKGKTWQSDNASTAQRFISGVLQNTITAHVPSLLLWMTINILDLESESTSDSHYLSGSQPKTLVLVAVDCFKLMLLAGYVSFFFLLFFF